MVNRRVCINFTPIFRFTIERLNILEAEAIDFAVQKPTSVHAFTLGLKFTRRLDYSLKERKKRKNYKKKKRRYYTILYLMRKKFLSRRQTEIYSEHERYLCFTLNWLYDSSYTLLMRSSLNNILLYTI